MSQKNETVTLIIALLITIALVGSGVWWFTQRSGLEISSTDQPSPDPANQSKQPKEKGFSQVRDVPLGIFNYGGSTSWAPIRLLVDSAIQAGRAEFKLRYVEPIGSPPSSGAGIKMLLDGQLALAQSSRPLLDREYNQAQQRGFKLQQISIAIDGLAVAVNPNLNIKGLTIEQLKAIYTGKITNWQQLGGPNLTIKPFSRPQGSGGTVEMFQEDILREESFSSDVVFVSTTTEALRKLAGSPGGIYYASAPEVVPQCSIKPLPIGRNPNELVPPYREPLVPASECPKQRNQLNVRGFQQGNYPLTRNLFVIVKQNGGAEQQAGEAYANLLLTGEGQELLGKAGFVRIR